MDQSIPQKVKNKTINNIKMIAKLILEVDYKHMLLDKVDQ